LVRCDLNWFLNQCKCLLAERMRRFISALKSLLQLNSDSR
jgi:hypothetical protein